MKLTIQKVKFAEVKRNEELISKSKMGYLILVCFKRNEDIDLTKVCIKVLNLKLFENWKKNIKEVDGDIMILSQFTLYGKIKGTKPSFHESEEYEIAKNKFYELINIFKNIYSKEKVFSGVFGEYLEINTCLTGPCTINLEFN
ncbi:D-tyrosyl-tRNA(Tyr) deacylase [Anncaliia algerae PRA339]|uniref:D-aminoacyl-tRNA deacylase n=1 Tax=Anncaliia algerae PRA339 TaxID=1288291 RepID=A0A059EY31_9MICR|nr:D-tyrosyl-tRNA(Tyr) deacylase [Anncaliia algerae PRA339]